MPMTDWPKRWEALREVCRKRSLVLQSWRVDEALYGSAAHPPALVSIEPPAAEREVLSVEEAMGTRLPAAMRRVFLRYSRKMDICWMFPEASTTELKNSGLPAYLYWGILYCSLADMPSLKKEYDGFLRHCDPDDDYDRHWFHKFPVLEAGFGDYVAVEMEAGGAEQVVYLSHEGDCDMHGRPLASDFEDFIDRMSLLGCPHEGYELEPFFEPDRPYLQPDGEKGRLWRAWFGLG